MRLGNNDFIFIDKKNVAIYCAGLGIVGNNVISSGISLPNGINFTDNICIFKSSDSYALFYTPNENNYFYDYNMTSILYCKTSAGSKISFDCYIYDSTNNTFSYSNSSSSFKDIWYKNVLFSYKDIAYGSGSDYLSCGCGDFFNFYYKYKYFPSITNTASNLAAGLDTVLILPGEFKKTEDFYFAILHTEEVEVEETGTSYTKEVVDYSTKLNADSPYFLNVYAGEVEDFWYEISPSVYADLLENDKQYIFRIQYDYNDETYYNDIYATWGGLTAADIEQNEKEEERYQEQLDAIYNQTEKIENQTDAIKEQTEVSKGIWGTLKEVLSYINPLSENFFAYKLINLLIDGLKSLFLPDERIF